jgi:hypothetical protein
MRFAAVLFLAIAACSPPSPTASHPSLTPTGAAPVTRTEVPTPSPERSYAVVVKDFLEGGATYSVSLVATDGHVAATATPRKRSRFVQIGNVSTSLTTLYYLDGDSAIHYLRPDGRTGLVTTLTLAVNQVAAFAVSPDDRRIAVSILDFTRYPVSTRLYVEDVTGHTNHLELFASSTVEEWPVGWHGGRLVMALGLNVPPQNLYEGFMRGRGYHVVDAQTGARLLSLCSGGDGGGPESPAGFVCLRYPNASVISWEGTSWPAPKDGSCAMWGPLSPTGLMANRITTTPSGGCRGNAALFLIDRNGTAYPQPNLPREAAPLGWIDARHLLLSADSAPNQLSVVDTVTGDVATINGASGFFAAALPGGL